MEPKLRKYFILYRDAATPSDSVEATDFTVRLMNPKADTSFPLCYVFQRYGDDVAYFDIDSIRGIIVGE